MDELTKALTDYYDPRTDLVRKQQLHDQLNRFLTDRNSWQIAVMTLQEQNGHLVTSPVVIYFLLQILEHSIRHRYGDQQQIRQILIYLFVHLFDSIPVYVRTKFSFLLVQLARCDNQWSIDEYFQTCFHVRSVSINRTDEMIFFFLILVNRKSINACFTMVNDDDRRTRTMQ